MIAGDAQQAISPALFEAQRLDAVDKLAPLRDRFMLPPGVLYFDGNSLGALPAAVPAHLTEVVNKDWGGGLISSWFDGGWWDAPERVGDLIAAIVGAAKGQVVVGDSVSVHVFEKISLPLP